VLEFSNTENEKAQIIIRDALGRAVFAVEKAVIKGFNSIMLNQVQPLAQGTYTITMQTPTNVFRTKFVRATN
jgi:hypothetical protein